MSQNETIKTEEDSDQLERGSKGAQDVVVEYVALEDFLRDQDAGIVVETSNEKMDHDTFVDNRVPESDKTGPLTSSASTSVPVQIVHPQRHSPDSSSNNPKSPEKTPIKEEALESSSSLYSQYTDLGISRQGLDALADAASVLGSVESTQLTTRNSQRPRMRKRQRIPVPDELKDNRYWERRQKNNLAAKRSRECKREKETQLSLKAAFLEKEHVLLRAELEKAHLLNQELKERLQRYEDQERKGGFQLSSSTRD